MGMQKLRSDLSNLQAIHGLTVVMKSSAGVKFQKLKKLLPGFKEYSTSVEENIRIANANINPSEISVEKLTEELNSFGDRLLIKDKEGKTKEISSGLKNKGVAKFFEPFTLLEKPQTESNIKFIKIAGTNVKFDLSKKNVLLIIVSSNMGFCGSFNREICNKAFSEYKNMSQKNSEVITICIGRKASEYFSGLNLKSTNLTFPFPDNSVDTFMNKIFEDYILNPFLDGNIAEIHVVYNSYDEVNRVIEIKPSMKQLLPLPSTQISNMVKEGEQDNATILEPGKNLLLAYLIEEYLLSSMQKCLRDSETAENYQRMRAMNQASEAVEEEIKKMMGTIRKTRQTTITRELVEIISGAEALKHK